MGKHARGTKTGDFCGQAGQSCSCSENYRTACLPIEWSGKEFAYPSHFVRKWQSVVFRGYEAHHVLCVACVEKSMFREHIVAIVRETKWCINAATNMIALPLWGQSVQHYMNNDTPPPWANLPQHDVDHNIKGGYTHEVSADLIELADEIHETKDDHTIETRDIAAQMNAYSAKWRSTLESRGAGTHLAWQTGDTNPAWYLPFSMAARGVARKRPFIGMKKKRTNSIARTLKKLANVS